jgi:hypothetical protein
VIGTVVVVGVPVLPDGVVSDAALPVPAAIPALFHRLADAVPVPAADKTATPTIANVSRRLRVWRLMVISGSGSG